MFFLADESCDFGVVELLRAAGHQVEAICEMFPRAEDTFVIQRSSESERILITEDKDFGWLVFVRGADATGVVLLRYGPKARGRIARDCLEFITEHRDSIAGCFTVLSPGQVRVSRRTWRRGPDVALRETLDD